ncbi:MAG: carboxypeptidase regulatory-like domain-containing protein [Sedimentisphaerales bacterium]|nr:carboxypeptidase regulatory-like domain-containing protein [Sedimentisphaerales bacterium]
MKLKNKKSKFIAKVVFYCISIIGIFPVLIYAADTNEAKTVTEIKPPFTFTIKTSTPEDKPLPGVKVRCTHPHIGRNETLVDMIVTSDANGIAKFHVTKAELSLDRWFWFHLADANYIGSGGIGISPIDNEYAYTLKALPAESFTISVIDNDNKPIEGANVWLLSDNPSFPSFTRGYFEARSSAATNAQGIADLKFAQIEANVIVSAKGYASEFFRAELLPKDEPFVVQLSKGYKITGRVVDKDNKPIKNAEISAEKENFILDYWEGFLLEATSDDEGKFVLENAKEGTYEIRTIMPKSHEELYTKPLKVTVENSSPEDELTILAERLTVIKGKYYGKKNFNMSLRQMFINIISPERNNWEINARNDGSFVISGIPENAQGSINFVGVAGYYMLLKIPEENNIIGANNDVISFNHLPLGTYEGFEVHYLLSGSATGKVLDLSGNPMSKCVLIVSPGNRIIQTNDKGQYIAEIPPNEDVTIEVRDSSSQFIYKTEPFKIEEGQLIQKDIIVGEIIYKLVGKILPAFENIKIDYDIEQARKKRILLCFFDIEQRPSRNCILELNKKAEELKTNEIEVLLIHATKVEKEYLDNWLKENNISFSIGMIETGPSTSLGAGEEQIKLNWGIKAFPWLILTDKDHIVTDEGISINDLEEKIKTPAFSVSGANDKLGDDEINRFRSFFKETSESIVGYHVDFQFDDYPLNEEYYPGGDYMNIFTDVDDRDVVDEVLESLRSSISGDASLDVFNSMFLFTNRSYDILDKEKNKPLGKGETSSFDGIQSYLYMPDNNHGMVSTDESSFQIPRNPLSVYNEAVKILGDTKRYEILSCIKDKQGNINDNNSKSLYIFELLDTKEENGYVQKFLVNVSNMQILYHRECLKYPEFLLPINQMLFQDFAICDLGNTNVNLPQTVIIESEDTGSKEGIDDPLIFAKKQVYTVKNISARKLTEQDSFKINYPAGTHVWNSEEDYEFYAKGDDNIPPKYTTSLIGQILPEFNDLEPELRHSEMQGKMVLVCLFDIEQRPSRNCIQELNKKAKELKSKDVEVIAIHASKIEQGYLNEWVQENGIDFQVGMIETDKEQMRFNWGVIKVLPWLILTNKEHKVTAEGFSLSEIGEKLK